ncbi:hypothetical protein MB901379_01373 [Mycobacterium basiliense]|uniref:Uncharacterized protein n=1 Tax=Mycobacterium basiliense TaxID=2094119 RepID=A0A3S4DS33_9MYCO|nr:hypothetical protein MB901379_01373 [Mycobacterium basiliense]
MPGQIGTPPVRLTLPPEAGSIIAELERPRCSGALPLDHTAANAHSGDRFSRIIAQHCLCDFVFRVRLADQDSSVSSERFALGRQ